MAKQTMAKVHIDFAGPMLHKQFLIIVDAHSKWPEVFPMNKITTMKTIELLRTVFARNGRNKLCRTMAPQFTSAESESFVKENGITQFRSAPYRPATNRLAERFVRTFKQSLKAMRVDLDQVRLSRVRGRA